MVRYGGPAGPTGSAGEPHLCIRRDADEHRLGRVVGHLVHSEKTLASGNQRLRQPRQGDHSTGGLSRFSYYVRQLGY